jgi:spore maturation protein CgeB
MIAAGYSPSVRLFEAAACGTPIVSDAWEGLDTILAPTTEITLAEGPADVLAALRLPEPERAARAAAARARILAEHTAERRAAELEAHLAEARAAGAAPAAVRQPRARETARLGMRARRPA